MYLSLPNIAVEGHAFCLTGSTTNRSSSDSSGTYCCLCVYGKNAGSYEDDGLPLVIFVSDDPDLINLIPSSTVMAGAYIRSRNSMGLLHLFTIRLNILSVIFEFK